MSPSRPASQQRRREPDRLREHHHQMYRPLLVEHNADRHDASHSWPLCTVRRDVATRQAMGSTSTACVALAISCGQAPLLHRGGTADTRCRTQWTVDPTRVRKALRDDRYPDSRRQLVKESSEAGIDGQQWRDNGRSSKGQASVFSEGLVRYGAGTAASTRHSTRVRRVSHRDRPQIRPRLAKAAREQNASYSPTAKRHETTDDSITWSDG